MTLSTRRRREGGRGARIAINRDEDRRMVDGDEDRRTVGNGGRGMADGPVMGHTPALASVPATTAMASTCGGAQSSCLSCEGGHD